MVGRSFSDTAYRFGFNGMERDDEVNGDGNSYTTEFRQYNVRLGRWLSTDPKIHHSQSSYTVFDNNPILFIDPYGANAIQVVDDNDIVYDDGADDGNIYYGAGAGKLGIKSTADVEERLQQGLITQIYKDQKLATPDDPSERAEFTKQAVALHKVLWDRLAVMDDTKAGLLASYEGSGSAYGDALKNYGSRVFLPADFRQYNFTFDQTFSNVTFENEGVFSVNLWNIEVGAIISKGMGNFTYNISLNSDYRVANCAVIQNIQSHEKKHVINALSIQSMIFSNQEEANNFFRNFELYLARDKISHFKRMN